MSDEHRIDLWGQFHGPNAGYVLEAYERYLEDPAAVDAATRALFEQWAPPREAPAARTAAPDGRPVAADAVMGAVNLAQAIREYGHLAAQLDPLGTPPPGDPELDPSAHGLTEDELAALPADVIGGPCCHDAANALEAVQALREVYSSTTGYDYDHVRAPEERAWLRQAAEQGVFRHPADGIDLVGVLERLTQIEAFEQFLHRIFPGRHRFSIEGLDIMVVMLDDIVCCAAEQGTHNVLLGMAHRGRLNVLAHVLGKPYRQLLAEFKDPVRADGIRADLGWTGDVKYHAGARRALRDGQPVETEITLAPNPSHLEFVNPVVEGMARAAGTAVDAPGAPRFDPSVTLPLLVHGDAAFPGQGIVAETLNLSRLPGYQTGGSIHIIANNQLGFTTGPNQGRSTLYASDVAKGFKIPIVHVNADDPIAAIEAARLALAYRMRFGRDFLIDLVGYRRYGHNEGDEPSFTQPLAYERIDDHLTVRAQWAERLIEQGTIERETAEALVTRHREALREALEALDPEADLAEPRPEPPPAGAARRVNTGRDLERLRADHTALVTVPDGFAVHPKLARALERRAGDLGDLDAPAVGWATAEELALASLLAEGIAVRMTGEDVERGTFSQRHAVWHDVEDGATYVPLQALPTAKAAFEIHNSPLSEAATLGFEYGYNVQAPDRLVVWEAQYGDFINVGQVMVDEFLTSARDKWGQTPSLVLLLPHGHEGAGPDHSTGRLERFLQLAADNNMRVAAPTSAAQYYHLLRRQGLLLETDPLPLVAMTPKSLLRNERIASTPRALAEGGWQPVLDDPEAAERRKTVRRLILCSGKVGIDLLAHDRRAETNDVAVARLEQLYPLPEDVLRGVLERYPALEEVVWLQEEPQNMGAWTFVQPRLQVLIDDRWPLRYIGRPRSASPAEGSAAWHASNQAQLLERAFSWPSEETTNERVLVEEAQS